MSKQIACWFAIQFRMRAGQGGWLPPGSATVVHGHVTLNVHRSRGGTIRTTKQIGASEASHGDCPEFIVHKTDQKEVQAVDVIVPIKLDRQRFEQGIFDERDFENALQAASNALSRKLPDIPFWKGWT